MIYFGSVVEKYDKKGEKFGWNFILIPKDLANKINPQIKRTYRGKGKLNNLEISGLSLTPIRNGNFILGLKNDIRKKLNVKEGDHINGALEVDHEEPKLSPQLMLCLEDDPIAKNNFYKLPKSHQRYFSNWITGGKLTSTKSVRIEVTLKALCNGLSYGEMIRENKKKLLRY